MTISQPQALKFLGDMTLHLAQGLPTNEFPKFVERYGWKHQDKLGGQDIPHYRTQPGDTLYTMTICVLAEKLGLPAQLARKGKESFAYIPESHFTTAPSMERVAAAIAQNAGGILSARPDIAGRITGLNAYMGKTGISPFAFDAGSGTAPTMNLRATAPDMQTAGYAHELLRAKGVSLEVIINDAGTTLTIKDMGRIQRIRPEAFAGEPAAAMEKPPQRGFWGKLGSPFSKPQAG